MSDRIIRGKILEVPFREKNQAKEMGAWWDPQMKKWFVPGNKDPEPFRRWFPEENKARSSSSTSAE